MSEEAVRRAASPPRRSGHYSTDGHWWWEDRQRCWLPVADEQVDTLQVEVELVEPPAGEPWDARAAEGQAWYRLVGRATSADPRWPSYEVAGESFPAPRMPLEELSEAMWLDALARRLEELRDTLRVQGWRCVGRGPRRVSLACVRPWLVPNLPAQGVSAAGASRSPRR